MVLAATVGLAFAAGGSAPGQKSPPPEPHLLIVHDAPPERSALDRSGHRVVADYGGFMLVEATGDAADRLRDAGADERDDLREVATARGRQDAALRPPAQAKSGRLRATRGGSGLALVQFVGPVKD